MPNTPFEPSWKKYEKNLRSDDVETARKAGDAFDETRRKELANSPLARKWESDRKKAVAKDKKHYIKEMEEKERLADPILQFKQQLKSAGVHAWGLNPAKGFMVIELSTDDPKTEGGVFLPSGVEEGMENTGTVVGHGGGEIHYSGLELAAPAEVGDKVMFKKGAGVDVTLKGKKYRFITYGDVLGVFTEN